MTMIALLKAAGVLHLGLVAAGALMPRAVGLRHHLSALPDFVRRLVWVYYTFIGLCLIAFGTMTFFLAGHLASGVPLARSLCAFLCLFWTLRLVVATFVFDVRPYLTSGWRVVGYHCTNVVFALLPLIYGCAAMK